MKRRRTVDSTALNGALLLVPKLGQSGTGSETARYLDHHGISNVIVDSLSICAELLFL